MRRTTTAGGNFDLVIDDPYQLTDSPRAYWNGIYHLPLNGAGSQTSSSFERYVDQQAWKLVQVLDRTPPHSRICNQSAASADRELDAEG